MNSLSKGQPNLTSKDADKGYYFLDAFGDVANKFYSKISFMVYSTGFKFKYENFKSLCAVQFDLLRSGSPR